MAANIPPLNFNQTPISGATHNGALSTGPFFSNAQPQSAFQGSHDLLGGAQFNASTGGGVAIAGVALLFMLLLTGGKK